MNIIEKIRNLFRSPEIDRRKNSRAPVESILPERPIKAALVRIAAVTTSEMTDAEFREYAQRIAHEALTTKDE